MKPRTKLSIMLSATLLATLYLGHQANNIEWPKPPPAPPTVDQPTDCWDEPSCAATKEGYIVTDPNGTSDTRPPAGSGATVNDLRGDDNGDGTIDEDESGWNCETMGNGICGTRYGN